MSAMVYANVPTTSQNINDELVVASGSDAPDPIVRDWDYEDTGDEIIINRYKGTKENVTVPEEINGKPVVELANSVFSGLGVKKVTIPDSVEIMGDNIFRDCTRLESVKLSNSITELHGYVFGGCENLKEIVLPESLQYFSVNIFNDSSIERLNIPKNVEGIFFDEYDPMPNTIKEYTVDEDNEYFTVIDGMVLSKNEEIFYFYPKSIDDYTYIMIPDSVMEIKSLYEIPNLSNVNVYLGENIELVSESRSFKNLWVDPESYIYEYINVQLNENVNPITKEDFQEMMESDFWFGYKDNGMVVLEYLGNDDHMEIPSHIGNNEITQINSGLFSNKVSAITIPDTFKKFDNNGTVSMGFDWCIAENDNLTKIVNNSNVKLPVRYLSHDYLGWSKDQSGKGDVLDYIPAKSTVYRVTKEPFHNYFMEVTNAMRKLSKTGINASDARTADDAVKYIYNYIPKHEDDNYHPVVEIFEGVNNYFIPATSTKRGKICLQVKIYQGDNYEWDDYIYNMTYYIHINPDKSTGGSSGGSSSGGSSSDRDESNNAASYRHKDVKINNTSENKSGNWTQNEKGWWFQYKDDTWPSNEWLYLPWGDGYNWYFFDANGYMSSGWVLWNGHYYYMNGNSDGNKGAMLTGWQFIDGKWYYLESNITSKYGAMYKNRRTPDGYYVGDDGAWVQ